MWVAFDNIIVFTISCEWLQFSLADSFTSSLFFWLRLHSTSQLHGVVQMQLPATKQTCVIEKC